MNRKLELKWETTLEPSLTCSGCRKVISSTLSISTPSDVNPVVWLRLCRDCLSSICDYVNTQKQTDDEWLKANGFAQAACYYCGDPLVMMASEYSKYVVYKCEECSRLSDKERELRRSTSGRTA